MSEQQSEDLLDELLATTVPAQITQEIAAILNTAESGFQRVNMLVALVKRTNDPTAIDALADECFAHGDEPVGTTKESLLRAAAILANHPMSKVSYDDQQRGSPQFFAALAVNDYLGRSAEEIARYYEHDGRLNERARVRALELGFK